MDGVPRMERAPGPPRYGSGRLRGPPRLSWQRFPWRQDNALLERDGELIRTDYTCLTAWCSAAFSGAQRCRGPRRTAALLGSAARALSQQRSREQDRPDDNGDHRDRIQQEAECLLLGAQRVQHPPLSLPPRIKAVLDEVDGGVDDDPHHVHEMPVDPRDLDATVLLGGVVAAERADRDEQQQDQADRDVRAM